MAFIGSTLRLFVIAWRTHVGWGLAIAFGYPFGAFVFAVQHWKAARWVAVVNFVSMIAVIAAIIALQVAHPTSPAGRARAVAASPSPRP